MGYRTGLILGNAGIDPWTQCHCSQELQFIKHSSYPEWKTLHFYTIELNYSGKKNVLSIFSSSFFSSAVGRTVYVSDDAMKYIV